MNKQECLCGKREYKMIYDLKKFQIVKCIYCKLVRTITNSKVSRKQLYNRSDIQIYLEKEEMFRHIFQKKLKFIQKFKKKGKLIDIGAGIGLFLSEAEKVGFSIMGFEPSQVSVQVAAKNYNISLFRGEFDPKIINAPIDIIVLNHVIEHLPNPMKIISDINKILNINAILVIGAPNFSSLMSILKRSRWQNLIPDQHRWHYNIQTLDNLILPFGYKRIGMENENHIRDMYPIWKKVIFYILDNIALFISRGEAMLVIYKRVKL